LSLSTLADQVGAVCTVMQPIFERIEGNWCEQPTRLAAAVA